jgi:hypothetical protein
MLLDKFKINESGVSAIEGALLLPIAIILFLGTFEGFNLLIINQKVSNASATASDLLSREILITNEILEEAYAAAQLVMEPLDSTNLGMQIVGVEFNSAGNPVENWFYTENVITRDTDLHLKVDTGPGSTPLGVAGEGLIVAQILYQHTPVFGLDFFGLGAVFAPIVMNEITFARGRQVSCIPYDDGMTIFTCS